jgi:predicted secreted Zn-dependent protease
MKRIGVLLALFCVGLLAASFAFADDGGKGKGKNKNQATTGSTSTSSSGKKCKNVSLKGTAAVTTFTVTVDKSSKAGRDLKGKPATLTFSGKVNINARMCSAGSTATPAAATFELRNLKVAKPSGDDD